MLKFSPGISVIICCYNSAEVIVPTLQALSAQRVPPGFGYEIIVVDNNCTDDTVQRVEKTWENASIHLQIVNEPQPGLIYARKTGVSKARFDIILFIDDDNILEPDWIERLLDMYSQWPEVGAIGGYNEPLFESGEKPAWFDKFASMYACTPSHENPGVSDFKQTLFGAGLSLRTKAARSVFDSPLPLFLVGRTQDALIRGEDSEICLRIALMGWKLWYECTINLKHYILKRRVNWEYVLKARRGGGHADIILKIYRDLLEGNTPLKYHELSLYISSLWEEFWQLRSRYKDLFTLNREGESPSVRYHYLQGLTDGFLRIDQHEYNKIRQNIIRFYSTFRSKE